MAESNTLSIVCEQCHNKVHIPALAHRQRAVCPVCNALAQTQEFQRTVATTPPLGFRPALAPIASN